LGAYQQIAIAGGIALVLFVNWGIALQGDDAWVLSIGWRYMMVSLAVPRREASSPFLIPRSM